ncbi:MAG: RodZ domain-containing protein [Pseudomonadota bacterium]
MIGLRKAPVKSEPPVEVSGLQRFDDFEVRLGDVMRGERATMGKSLLDVQRELKIKASFVRAIENADPSAFETPGFVAGYVRSYARYLGLDPEWAYTLFCKESGFQLTHAFEPSGPLSQSKKRPDGAVRGTVSRDPFENPNTPFKPRGESPFAGIEPGALGSAAVLIALIAGLGYGGWTVLQQVQRVDIAAVDQAPGVLDEVETLSPGLSIDQDSAVLAPPPVDGYDRLYRPQPLDVPVLIARDAPIASLDPGSTGVLAGNTGLQGTITGGPPADTSLSEATPVVATNTGATPPQVNEEGPTPVVVFAVRPSWVRIRAADGSVILERILDAGEQFVVPRTEEAPTMRVGNAGSVYFRAGDRILGPAGEGASVVKNLRLAEAALSEQFAPADLEGDAALATTVATFGPIILEDDANRP